MKTLRTLTVTVAVVASLALCVTSAKASSAGITTNYNTVNISLTITTNSLVETANGVKSIIKSQKLVTKDLLNMLTGSDFAGFPFPTGSKLVMGLDGNWNGDLLVVDKSGTNVLYDATHNYGEFDVATVVINPYNQTGAPNLTLTEGSKTDNLNVTWYNNASFQLMDQNANINITGTGPCTEHFVLNGFTIGTSTNIPSWTDSQRFAVYGASETNGISSFESHAGTLSGSIMMSGSGKGFAPFLTQQIGSLIF
jgi:hypothetical protein